MSTLAVNLSLTARQSSSSLLRYCVPKAHYHAARNRPGRRNERKEDQKLDSKKSQPASNITILGKLKEPIERSRKLITELEVMLLNHEHNQAQSLAQFNIKLAEIKRLEPQREWYYDQLGIPMQDKKKQT